MIVFNKCKIDLFYIFDILLTIEKFETVVGILIKFLSYFYFESDNAKLYSN